MRGGYAVRLVSLVVGLFLFALAIVLILESKLGLSPWDVLNQGLAKHTPLSFGMANVAVGLTVLLVAWSLGGPPGLGTFANAVLVGTFIQGLTAIPAVTALADEGLSVRIPLLLVGIWLIGPASAFTAYMTSRKVWCLARFTGMREAFSQRISRGCPPPGVGNSFSERSSVR